MSTRIIRRSSSVGWGIIVCRIEDQVVASRYRVFPHNSIDDLRDNLALSNIATIRINYAILPDICRTGRLREYLADFWFNYTHSHYPWDLQLS